MAAPAAGGDGIDALPNEALHHILGFLEAHEAVRTCVLAKRWRYLWKHATGLRVVADNGEFLGSVEKAWEFLDRLLPLREGSPLHACELRFGDLGFYETDGLFNDDGARHMNTWFWHAIYGDYWVQLDDMPLKSQHLTRLEFAGVEAYSSFLNFSNCPMQPWNIYALTIVSWPTISHPSP
ncbi:hypothetical protein BAE44_0005490 [Dichanthelium oligosanthes]|uniref:F-box domain-containing protein n=1 Tax=Dichanthelium oligosanthes TaxID=888268 RepID=A0A1E5W8B5_9POAL|nr:hypothetical protein BAE44_0005490 [Dichanthelium oligosanthes]